MITNEKGKMPYVEDRKPEEPQLGDDSQFGNQRRLRFGPLRISKEGIFVNDGTNDVVKLSASGFQSYDASSINTTTLNSTGFHGYDTSGNELVKIDSTGFHGYLTAGTETIRISGTGIEGYGTTGNTFKFYDVQGGTLYGQIGYSSASNAMYIYQPSTSKNLYLVSNKEINLGADTDINILADVDDSGAGNVYLKGANQASSGSSGVFLYDSDNSRYFEVLSGGGTTKTAIVPTSKGYKALYCTESPEVWFFDFCYGKRIIKNLLQFWKTEWEVKPDPLFLEVTEPPYTIIQTGTKNTVQLWGRRKDTKDKRFADKTESEFKENNKFWGEPMRRAKKG